MDKKYTVFIDDNYHHGDGGRLVDSSYDTLQEAIERCEEFTIDSLSYFYEKGITAEDLSAQWSLFGEDAFIRGADTSVPFSARKFITVELCQGIIDAKEGNL